MNANLNQKRLLGLVAAALLGACSGGNFEVSVDGPIVPGVPNIPPTQGSEPIVAHGAITGLGGVTINDVRFSTGLATVRINDQPGALSDLRHGHVITVTGRINDDGRSGTANHIRFDANLVGPVDSIDATNGRLMVMGQTVFSDSDTLFGGGIDPATFAGIAVGDTVQVSGFSDASGAIRAMRIEPASANAELHVIGDVTLHDAANLFFRINRLTVDYGNASLIDLPGGAPVNGMPLKVIGTVARGVFTAERLLDAPDLGATNGRRVKVAGVVTRFNSTADFDVNGLAAATNAGTAFRNGNAGNLALNAELVMDGDYSANGRVTANRIAFGRIVSSTTRLTYGYSNFNAINVPTVFNVYVTQAPEYSVEVVVDEEVAGRVDVTQSGSTLRIALLPGDGNIESLDAFVTMPVLDRIDLTGVAHANLYDFDQAQMTINVGGVSLLRGHDLDLDDLTANVTGVSHLDLADVRPIGNASIEVGGVSQATLNMAVGSRMTGSVGTGQGTGVSTLFYYGTNVSVDVTTDFLSSVIWLGQTRP